MLSQHSVRKWEWRRGIMLALAGGVCSGIMVATAAAGTPVTYNRIEEDWELVVNTPDPVAGSPQVALQMAPDPASPLVGSFLINYRDTPDFVAGGVQAQLWNQDTNIATADFRTKTLATPGEKIAFTLYMDRSSGQLKYGVAKGKCETWGDLGKAELNIGCPDSSSTFPNYQSAYSVQNAMIVCGATRVQSLKLVAVRKYYPNKKGYDTESSRTVYP